MPEKQFFVIKTGDTFPDLSAALGDFEDWIVAGLGLTRADVRTVNAGKGQALPETVQVRGAVISGSHAMVTDNLPWSLALEGWTRQVIDAGIPLLGICYGHQIMARAMGGEVGFHPGGTEIGTREIRCLPSARGDALFDGLPQAFKAHAFHSQTVTRLPENAVLLGENDFEPHHAFRLGKMAWGVQFHPEANAAATRGYVRNLTAALAAEGQDAVKISATIEETPHAAAVLRRFAKVVTESRK